MPVPERRIVTSASSVEAIFNPVNNAGRDFGFVTLEPEGFGGPKAISIDYAVMKTSRAAVVPVSCVWSDVGSWYAVRARPCSKIPRHCNVATDQALVALEGAPRRAA